MADKFGTGSQGAVRDRLLQPRRGEPLEAEMAPTGDATKLEHEPARGGLDILARHSRLLELEHGLVAALSKTR